MEPFSSALVGIPELASALESESAYERVWLPPEPWWPALLSNKDTFCTALHRKLLRGTHWPQSHVVDVRKTNHGIRPVSLMSPEVRIVYRALVEALIPESERFVRNAESYAEFVIAPITAAFPNIDRYVLGDARFRYIVTADIAAYYQYIDHGLLQQELDLIDGDVTVIDGLVGFLGDIQARSFGIPQRSEPSDWLSDVYAARIHRAVARDGFEVWRYSDDFRIACTRYSEALRAVEALSRVARDLGLVLNEQKTLTYSFIRYVIENSNVSVDNAVTEFDPTDVEAAVTSDYLADDEEEEVDVAHHVIERIHDHRRRSPTHIGATGTDGDDDWDVRELDVSQHRALRRALNTLTTHGDDYALPKLLSILAYQPSLTYRVIPYVVSLEQSDDSVERFFEQVVMRLSLTEWQRVWVIYGLRIANVDTDEESPTGAWLQTQTVERPMSLVAAEASLALAAGGHLSYETLENRLRIVSEDVAPWYLHALKLLDAQGRVRPDQIAALRRSSALAAAILA